MNITASNCHQQHKELGSGMAAAANIDAPGASRQAPLNVIKAQANAPTSSVIEPLEQRHGLGNPNRIRDEPKLNTTRPLPHAALPPPRRSLGAAPEIMHCVRRSCERRLYTSMQSWQAPPMRHHLYDLNQIILWLRSLQHVRQSEFKWPRPIYDALFRDITPEQTERIFENMKSHVLFTLMMLKGLPLPQRQVFAPWLKVLAERAYGLKDALIMRREEQPSADDEAWVIVGPSKRSTTKSAQKSTGQADENACQARASTPPAVEGPAAMPRA